MAAAQPPWPPPGSPQYAGVRDAWRDATLAEWFLHHPQGKALFRIWAAMQRARWQSPPSGAGAAGGAPRTAPAGAPPRPAPPARSGARAPDAARAGPSAPSWPALAGPGLAGDCWFVVPVRFCDWARGLDGVYLLTRRELFALQPRPLCCRFRLVTVVVVTKSRLPKVGSPTLGSVVVRRTAGAGYPATVPWKGPGPGELHVTVLTAENSPNKVSKVRSELGAPSA